MRASLTYFERRTTNLIDFQSCFVARRRRNARRGRSGFYFNIGRTQSKGVEAEIAGAITDTLNAHGQLHRHDIARILRRACRCSAARIFRPMRS